MKKSWTDKKKNLMDSKGNWSWTALEEMMLQRWPNGYRVILSGRGYKTREGHLFGCLYLKMVNASQKRAFIAAAETYPRNGSSAEQLRWAAATLLKLADLADSNPTPEAR